MKIQLRDQKIMSSVLKYGLLSSEQIGELFFKNLHHSVIMRRLRILEKEKFILRIDALPNNQSAWSLGSEGVKFLNVAPPGRYTNRNTTLHDVTVSAVRLSLEEVGLCHNYSTEMELKKRFNWKLDSSKKEFNQVPDGLFIAKLRHSDADAVVALEVELNAKNLARYNRIVSHYLDKTSMHYVWYVVKNEGIANAILREFNKWKARERSPTFLFSFIENTKNDTPKLQVYSTANRGWVSITHIFDLPRLNVNASPTTDQPIGRESAHGCGSEAA